MSSIRSLASLSSADTAIAGGKGASLGELLRAGIPVPDGFVICTDAFDAFIQSAKLTVEIDAILKTVDLDAMHTVENASEKIQALIQGTSMPKDLEKEIMNAFKKLDTTFVAVRSSATSEDSKDAAWAGQLDTELNVTEKNLIESVQHCFASLFSPRAIFYRFEQKLHKKKISVAVVVQQMVESEKSGVAFSVHPVTQDRNQMIIEAVFGLGEALVSGSVTPDSFVIRKDNNAIIDTQVHEQTKGLFRGKNGGSRWQKMKKGDGVTLSAHEVKELAVILKKIEKHYGFPVDVEWAQAKGKWFILQSRPITTLTQKSSKPSLTFEFSWGEMHSVMTTELWLTSYVKHRDLPANENQHVAMDVQNGHVSTFNAAEEMPMAYEAGKAFLKPQFLPWYLKTSTNVRTRFEALRQKVEMTNLKKLSNTQLSELLDAYQVLFVEVYALFKISQPEYQMAASDHMRSLLKLYFKKEKDLEEAFIALTTPTEMDMMKEEEVTAMKISLMKGSTKEAVKRYAERFSWFFFNTYDRKIIGEFLKNRFDDLQAMSTKERKEFIAEAEHSIEKQKKIHDAMLKKVKKDKEIAYLSSLFGTLGNDRLELKIWWTGAEYLFLSLFEEMADRLKLSTEEFLMTHRLEEVFKSLQEGLRLSPTLRKNRRKRYACVLDGDNVRFLEADEAVKFAKQNNLISTQQKIESTHDIRGVVANTGKATGIARVIHVESLKELLHDMKRFGEGEIIVTTMTQPSIASMARKAAAIVTNEGGITSHASILAREFGIPCVVGTKTATQMIKDGDTIEVDAYKGVVKVLGAQPDAQAIDWEVYIERDISLYLLAAFVRTYDSLLLKTTGFRFEHQLYTHVGKTGTFYRSKKEMIEADKHFLALAQDAKKCQALAKKGHEYNKSADKLLDDYADWSPDYIQKNYEKLLKICEEIILYSTIIPYRMLSGINSAIEKDASAQKKLQKIIDLFEPLRAETRYPQLGDTVFKAFWKAAATLMKQKDYHLFSYLSPAELADVFSHKKIPENIDQRKKWCAFFVGKNEHLSFQYDRSLEQSLGLKADMSGVTELNGNTAYRGHAKGTVRIINKIADGKNFKKGDILVSVNTSPSLLPLLKQAGAIVTDEGGIMCHAAIVSREMKKPCVIGTKIATKVLKDGDKVEVDATKGIVKILH